jgi:hypothetical protein
MFTGISEFFALADFCAHSPWDASCTPIWLTVGIVLAVCVAVPLALYAFRIWHRASNDLPLTTQFLPSLNSQTAGWPGDSSAFSDTDQAALADQIRRALEERKRADQR